MENEAIRQIKEHLTFAGCEDLMCSVESLEMAMQALEEIQQYRAIGTVEELINTQIREKVLNVELECYKEIGTIDEFKALKEKMQDVEITIINRMQEFYDEYRRISQSSVDHFGGKADAIEVSQMIVKDVFKDVLGIEKHSEYVGHSDGGSTIHNEDELEII